MCPHVKLVEGPTVSGQLRDRSLAPRRVGMTNSVQKEHDVTDESSTARIGIVTVSDRASRGEYEDRGGPAIKEYFDEVLTSPWEPVARVISDDRVIIEQTLRELCDDEGCSCLLYTSDAADE